MSSKHLQKGEKEKKKKEKNKTEIPKGDQKAEERRNRAKVEGERTRITNRIDEKEVSLFYLMRIKVKDR